MEETFEDKAVFYHIAQEDHDFLQNSPEPLLYDTEQLSFFPKMEKKMNDLFGYSSFRDLQIPAVNAAAYMKDVLVKMG